MNNMVSTVSLNDPEYPRLLKEVKNPPDILYYKGAWDSTIFDRCLAVVGSRRMTKYGRQITEKLVSEIAYAGITIVSGFMYGIDATAHKAALDAGGRTIAVMPCGIEMIHPGYQKELYEEILAKKGLVVSQFEGIYPPAVWTYPKRNIIVAGLSAATLVVEASLGSGSLITSDIAKVYNRQLFAVPGPLTSHFSQGTLQLIKEGAVMVLNAQDVLKTYRMESIDRPLSTTNEEKNLNTRHFSNLSLSEKTILDKLELEAMGIDRLSRLTGISIPALGSTLSLMQIKGLLYKEEARYYVK